MIRVEDLRRAEGFGPLLSRSVVMDIWTVSWDILYPQNRIDVSWDWNFIRQDESLARHSFWATSSSRCPNPKRIASYDPSIRRFCECDDIGYIWPSSTFLITPHTCSQLDFSARLNCSRLFWAINSWRLSSMSITGTTMMRTYLKARLLTFVSRGGNGTVRGRWGLLVWWAAC